MRYDIAIIGTGPAGVSAALTARNRNKSILLIGSSSGSSKIRKTHRILNYPGVPDVSGEELNRRFLDQLKNAGIVITDRRAAAVYAMDGYFTLQADQEFIEASSVILTTGTSFGKPYPGESENLGHGVSYCATCDAPLYRGKEAVVIGWSPKEEQEAAFLSETCSKVTYIPMYRRSGDNGEKGTSFFGSAGSADPVRAGRSGENRTFLPENVRVLYARPLAIEKADGRMRLLLEEQGQIHSAGDRRNQNEEQPKDAGPEKADAGAEQQSGGAEPEKANPGAGQQPERSIDSDVIFLLRESVAPDRLVPGLELDGNHVKTDSHMATNLPGLFAAGDLTGLPYQIAKAVGEGNIAALSASGYVDRLAKAGANP